MEIFPSIMGTLGNWKYYSTKMTAGKLATTVKFASEVWEAKALDYWIQRALNVSRAKNDIARYLARHEDHFFNSIVVAAIEGEPKFYQVDLAADERFQMLADNPIGQSFGVLSFDGTQQYYALDGQHRLKAIRALIDHETDFPIPSGFLLEEFPVLIVVPREGESRDEFMVKYRRLFSHLNRYAKAMDTATTIIMDEDDAIAICTRRLIQDHEYFQWFEDGTSARIRAKGPKNVTIRENYFTSIEVLYNMNKTLLDTSRREKEDIAKLILYRPDDDILQELYDELVIYWDGILNELPFLRDEPRLMRSDIGEDRIDDEKTISNNVLFRPIGQELFARLVRQLLDVRLDDVQNPTPEQTNKALTGLSEIEWRLHKAPWRHLLLIYDDPRMKWKMRSEERKKAIAAAYTILLYIIGITHYDEEMRTELKDQVWKPMLLEAPEEDIEPMWEEIEDQAHRYRDAAGL